METERYLKITFTPVKVPKNRGVRWLFWNVYWKVWMIWRFEFLAFIFLKLAKLFEKISNTEKQHKDENIQK